ncbi:MAG: 2-succinyl-5-enolpyruvyl-6-hydroxy-3-cyclohexene-1-carboxylate synthase, partial [Actinobacteria bacterium]|nr:2-succinyl-5-enolpyruvyl-6-hydroxy-3-cyclohexene-1-carboxylate synthase [Actinomycetota bacterium]
PGPVHLNVALRDPLVPLPDGPGFPHPLDGRPDGRPWVVADRPVRPPSPGQVDALARLVDDHERGVVVAGDVDTDPAPLAALAEAAGWPLLAEPQSGARTGPHAVSTYASLLAGPSFAAAHRPSAAVVVGKVGLSRPLLALLGPDVEQVLVDPDGLDRDPRRAVSRVVAADPAPLCAALAAALAPRPPSAWLRAWLRAEARARKAIDEVLDAAEAPSEPPAARDLAALAPDGATLTVANSMPVRDLDRVMWPRRGLRVLANRGASGIDGFVSTALGVALATAGPALALAGDLSLLHDQNGLLLQGESVDCVLVVVNNDGGGIFSFLPQAGFPDGFERLFGTPHGVDLASLAAVHGVGHRLVEAAAALPAAVAAAGERGGVQIVEVRTDRADNRALHRRLNERVDAALGA